MNLFLLKDKRLVKLVDLEQVVVVTRLFSEIDNDCVVSKLYYNVVATIVSYENKGVNVDLSHMKKEFGILYMDILSIKVGEIEELYWSTKRNNNWFCENHFIEKFDGTLFPVVSLFQKIFIFF